MWRKQCDDMRSHFNTVRKRDKWTDRWAQYKQVYILAITFHNTQTKKLVNFIITCMLPCPQCKMGQKGARIKIKCCTCQISTLSQQKCDITAPQPSKFGILSIMEPLSGKLLEQFLPNFQCLCGSTGSHYVFIWSFSVDRQPSYNHLFSLGHFPKTFQQRPLAAKVLSASEKKLRDAKMGQTIFITKTSLLGIVDHMPIQAKSAVFFVCLSHLELQSLIGQAS